MWKLTEHHQHISRQKSIESTERKVNMTVLGLLWHTVGSLLKKVGLQKDWTVCLFLGERKKMKSVSSKMRKQNSQFWGLLKIGCAFLHCRLLIWCSTAHFQCWQLHFNEHLPAHSCIRCAQVKSSSLVHSLMFSSQILTFPLASLLKDAEFYNLQRLYSFAVSIHTSPHHFCSRCHRV